MLEIVQLSSSDLCILAWIGADGPDLRQHGRVEVVGEDGESLVDADALVLDAVLHQVGADELLVRTHPDRHHLVDQLEKTGLDLCPRCGPHTSEAPKGQPPLRGVRPGEVR